MDGNLARRGFDLGNYLGLKHRIMKRGLITRRKAVDSAAVEEKEYFWISRIFTDF